jgi:NADPH:quinone reductase-like Zn-dependent oxidoreductase
MKAMIHTKYGPPPKVMKLAEITKPTPSDDEVLVKVHATCVNFNNLIKVTGEIVLARLMGMGFFKPKRHITGNDLAGTVEAVGKVGRRHGPGRGLVAPSKRVIRGGVWFSTLEPLSCEVASGSQ